MFDLDLLDDEDPFEMRNLAGDPKHRAKKDALVKELRALGGGKRSR